MIEEKEFDWTTPDTQIDDRNEMPEVEGVDTTIIKLCGIENILNYLKIFLIYKITRNFISLIKVFHLWKCPSSNHSAGA